MSLPSKIKGSLRCIECAETLPAHTHAYRCACGGTLDFELEMPDPGPAALRETFDRRLAAQTLPDASGVWRFRELIAPGLDPEVLVTRREGNTGLYSAGRIGRYVGMKNLTLKHEGENPTGSFKDRGMACAVTVARLRGAKSLLCASTGNTAASMAAYGAALGIEALILIPEGAVAFGKLAQSLAYGAKTFEVRGNFDDCMGIVEELAKNPRFYLLNSVNPFRIEGQKSMAFEICQQRGWQAPDWIVMPGGNLGNSSALAKGMGELVDLGLIARIPRIAVVQARGAAPFFRLWTEGGELRPEEKPETVATAIRIGNPVNWRKSLRGIEASRGVVEAVSDEEIMDAKAQVDGEGIGAEPASCSAVAGVKRLVDKGIIEKGDDVVAVLTGHVLKDPQAVIDYHTTDMASAGIRGRFANRPILIDADVDAILREIE